MNRNYMFATSAVYCRPLKILLPFHIQCRIVLNFCLYVNDYFMIYSCTTQCYRMRLSSTMKTVALTIDASIVCHQLSPGRNSITNSCIEFVALHPVLHFLHWPIFGFTQICYTFWLSTHYFRK